MTSIPVIFIYLGDRLPRYVYWSIQMAVKYSNQEVILIVNDKNMNSFSVPGCKFVSVESFYNSNEFNLAKRNLAANVKFRDSLWSKSLERFFVLYQYMLFSDSRMVFHAELDQFLFDSKSLVESLAKQEFSGIFSTCHSGESVVASVFFCNSLESFKDFLDFSTGELSFSSEMQLLASWAQHRHRFFELPNVDAFLHNRGKSHLDNVSLIPISVLGGVVDSAEFGQWFGGIDPRNVSIFQYPKNKFVGPATNINLSRSELASCKLSFKQSHNRLLIDAPGLGSVQIFNLHIHSKVHSRSFLSNEYLLNVIERVNFGESFRFKWTRSRQLIDYFSSYTEIIIYRIFRLIRRNLGKLVP